MLLDMFLKVVADGTTLRICFKRKGSVDTDVCTFVKNGSTPADMLTVDYLFSQVSVLRSSSNLLCVDCVVFAD